MRWDVLKANEKRKFRLVLLFSGFLTFQEKLSPCRWCRKLRVRLQLTETCTYTAIPPVIQMAVGWQKWQWHPSRRDSNDIKWFFPFWKWFYWVPLPLDSSIRKYPFSALSLISIRHLAMGYLRPPAGKEKSKKGEKEDGLVGSWFQPKVMYNLLLDERHL